MFYEICISSQHILKITFQSPKDNLKKVSKRLSLFIYTFSSLIPLRSYYLILVLSLCIKTSPLLNSVNVPILFFESLMKTKSHRSIRSNELSSDSSEIKTKVIKSSDLATDPRFSEFILRNFPRKRNFPFSHTKTKQKQDKSKGERCGYLYYHHALRPPKFVQVITINTTPKYNISSYRPHPTYPITPNPLIPSAKKRYQNASQNSSPSVTPSPQNPHHPISSHLPLTVHYSHPPKHHP